MHGHGRFTDPRLGIDVNNPPANRVTTDVLRALQEYQFSLENPTPAERGRAVFTGAGQCSTCHTGRLLTDVTDGRLHAPAEVASEPEPNGASSYALRSVTKMYRTTPLRGLQSPAASGALLPQRHGASARPPGRALAFVPEVAETV